MLTYKGLAYRKIVMKKRCEFFECQVCGERFMSSVFYRSDNLCYICTDCVEKMKNELNVLKNRKSSGYYRKKAKKFLSQQ